MKIRNRKITVRLSDSERDHLQEQADLVDLGIEPFVRNAILGIRMKPRPREEWAALLRQNAGVSTNINQIARQVNSGETASVETLRQVLDMQQQIWAKLKEF